jgi:transcriptional regulator of arginine metabolism
MAILYSMMAKNIYTFICITSQGFVYAGGTGSRISGLQGLSMKARRQSVILDVIRQQQVRSQEQLRRQMRGAGFDVTQATLSRDIRELGLVKGGPNGAYQAPLTVDNNGGQTPTAVFQRALGSQLRRIDRVQQLVLLRTGLGHAQSLCALLDGAGLPDVVGTLAGEDTILIVTPDVRRARTLVKRLEEMSTT